MKTSHKPVHLEELEKCQEFIARISEIVGIQILAINWKFNLRTLITWILLILSSIMSWITLFQYRNDVLHILETLCCYSTTIPVSKIYIEVMNLGTEL